MTNIAQRFLHLYFNTLKHFVPHMSCRTNAFCVHDLRADFIQAANMEKIAAEMPDKIIFIFKYLKMHKQAKTILRFSLSAISDFGTQRQKPQQQEHYSFLL